MSDIKGVGAASNANPQALVEKTSAHADWKNALVDGHKVEGIEDIVKQLGLKGMDELNNKVLKAMEQPAPSPTQKGIAA